MTSHCKGFPWLEAIRPFLQTPRLIVLLGEGGAVEKVEQGKDAYYPASLRPCRKTPLNMEETQTWDRQRGAMVTQQAS